MGHKRSRQPVNKSHRLFKDEGPDGIFMGLKEGMEAPRARWKKSEEMSVCVQVTRCGRRRVWTAIAGNQNPNGFNSNTPLWFVGCVWVFSHLPPHSPRQNPI